MRPMKVGNQYIIATNITEKDYSGTTGSLSRSIDRLVRSFTSWTGTKWVTEGVVGHSDNWKPENLHAMKFASREEAEEYMAEHKELLEQTTS